MRKTILLKIFIAVLGLFAAVDASAQTSGYQAIMGLRLIINAPLPAGGVKRFTYSASVTPSWGRALDSTWRNVPLQLASPDITACGTINNVTSANSWVLIYRGDCEFGAKALAAQNHGAAGVIIVNNIPASAPINMGAGASGAQVHIPVLMISNEDGNAIKDYLTSNPSLTISLTKWGFNLNNDLAFVPSSVAAGHNRAVPVTQISTGSPNAYKFYTGAFVANTGNHTATNIKIKQVTTFTPTGGSASVVYSDSAMITNLAVADSIADAFSANSISNNQTQQGRYDMTYTLTSDSTDDNPSDNVMTTSINVNGHVFCKGEIDPTTENPRATVYYSLQNNPNFSWGPLFYVNKGGYKADRVKFLVSDNDTTKHSLGGSVNIYIFKWADGANGGITDGYMESKELTLKSVAGRTFSSLDSNGQAITFDCADANGLPGTVVLEDNSWYWVAVDVPQGWFLGCDGNSNYYGRSFAAENATNKVFDYWAPLYTAGVAQMQANTTDTVKWIPFGVSNLTSKFIDSAAYSQVNGVVPAVAFFTGLFTENIHTATTEELNQISLYPNPATDVINAKISLVDGNKVSEIRVIDAMGRNVYQVNKADIKQDFVSINTSGFAAGTYHLLVGTNTNVLFRSFTVVSK